MCGSTGKTQVPCRWVEILKYSSEQRISPIPTIRAAIRGLPSMHRPEDKRKNHGPLFVCVFTEAQKDDWYASVDRIRQGRKPKKRSLTWLEPSAAEYAEEFA